jgi:hypothetical protein
MGFGAFYPRQTRLLVYKRFVAEVADRGCRSQRLRLQIAAFRSTAPARFISSSARPRSPIPARFGGFVYSKGASCQPAALAAGRMHRIEPLEGTECGSRQAASNYRPAACAPQTASPWLFDVLNMKSDEANIETAQAQLSVSANQRGDLCFEKIVASLAPKQN